MIDMERVAVAGRGSAWRTLATVCVFIAIVLALAWPAPARATMLEKMTIEQMSQRATTIVEGTVLSTEVGRWSGVVRTAVTLEVRDSLKGSASAVQTVYVPGGVLPDGTRVVVDGMASFSPGQSCYVFVDGRGWVMGGFQGKLSVENGSVTGTGETVASMSRRVEAALDRAGPEAASNTLSAPTPAAQVVSRPPRASASPLALPLTGLASTLLTDGFESGSLDGWSITDPSTWGVTTYRAASGTRSAYCMGSSAPQAYPENFLARMTTGPFDLSSEVGTGTLSADLWLDSEPTYDQAMLLVSTDNGYYYGNGWSGSTGGGWENVRLDLTNVNGQDLSRAPVLYVMVAFQSDGSVSGLEGAYFDNVLLEGDSTPPPGSPTITSISPGEASAGTNTHVAISGQDFGTATGQVLFSYGRSGVATIAASDIASWSDTAIDCAVPTGIIDNYSASAGSGPVVVRTSAGAASGPYAFTVPFGYGAAEWASPGVTYRVNTSGIDSVRREGLVDAGAAVWNGAGSAFRFTDGGTTAALFDDDGLNVISWADGLPSGVIAWAISYINGSTVTQCDIQFSNAFPWGAGTPGSNTMDIQTIAMHEVGHWLRLLDQYMPGDASKVMYGYGDYDQQKRTLMAGDIAGIRWVYPGAPPPPAPTLTGFNPTSGSVGATVTLTGTNFTGATAVAFHGTAALFAVNSATQITATVPAGATSGTISVTTPGGTATSSGSFTVTGTPPPAPTLTGFNPTSGSVGATVTLTGTNFTGATAVAFHGTAALFAVNSAMQITATVPAGATSGTISVTTPGGTATSSGSFTVTGTQVDVTAPVVECTGALDDWYYNNAVVLTVTATDEPGGSGVAAVHYTFDGVPYEQSGASVQIPIPAVPNGLHVLTYHGRDVAGNECADKTFTITMDTGGPVGSGRNASVRKGRYVSLRYLFRDTYSTRVWDVKVKVKNRSGRTVWSKSLGLLTMKSVDTWYSIRWRPLARGTYKYYVTCEDNADNLQARRAIATIRVN